jgi:hypothetical protein
MLKKALVTSSTSLRTLGDREDQVLIANVQEAIDQSSFGPFLLVLAIIEVSPIGAIPDCQLFWRLSPSCSLFKCYSASSISGCRR